MSDVYYIAAENYVLNNNNDDTQINVSIGNQFLLIETLEDDYLKLKPIDLELFKEKEIILPKKILENMSQSESQKVNPILRSQSAIKERICSLNLGYGEPDIQETCNFSSFGHGKTIHESIRNMSRSSYEPERKCVFPTLIKRQESETNEASVDSVKIRQNEDDKTWIKSKEDGVEVYINASTRQRWRATCDDAGRQYFYEEGSRKSAWNLPGQEQIGEEAVRPIEEVLENINESQESDEESWEDSDNPEEEANNVVLPPADVEDISELPKEGSKKFGIRHIKKEHISGPLFNKLMRTERSGFVDKTKVSENGRELQKKWTRFYMVLTGPELFFYKDAKAAVPKPGMPQGKAELKLKIQNLQFNEKNDSDVKGTVLQMEDTGAPGSNITYLLKFIAADDIRNWQMALQFAKDWKKEDMYSEKGSNLILTPDKKLLDTSNIDESSGDKQNIKLFLKQFLKIRPSPESLEARGILKPEAVFGSSLEILCEQEKNKVPEFVYRSILAIEARGLHHSGIYRVSGNQAKIQKLRLAVDENKYQLNSESMELETMTGAFKLFFKELKKPLLDEELCTKMTDLLSNRKVDKKNTYKDVNIGTAKKLISKMKSSHYETAKALFGHLKKVASYSSRNLMDVSNISMVWGPNLYSSNGQASTKMAVLLMTHNQIIDFLITRYSDIF